MKKFSAGNTFMKHFSFITYSVLLVVSFASMSCSRTESNESDESKTVLINPDVIGVSKSTQQHELGTILEPGEHSVPVSDTVVIYSRLMKETTARFPVNYANQNKKITVSIKYRYAPDEKRIDSLDYAFGPNYHNIMILAEIKSATREVFKQLNPQDDIDRDAFSRMLGERAGPAIHKKFAVLHYVALESDPEVQ